MNLKETRKFGKSKYNITFEIPYIDKDSLERTIHKLKIRHLRYRLIKRKNVYLIYVHIDDFGRALR